MNLKNFEEVKGYNSLNNSNFIEVNKKYFKNHSRCFSLISFIVLLTFINVSVFIFEFIGKNSKFINEDSLKKVKFETIIKQKQIQINPSKNLEIAFLKEKERPYLYELNKKRIFENRLPLLKKINCIPHFSIKELLIFLSFLTKDTIYFETGSGCSSIIAKYFAKKSYAVEGCKKWYEKGIQNGLKDNLIFHDLKPDNPEWSYPGKNSTIEDWKPYFQSYKKSYNADVILIDGRFKVATALDIFDKINEDTIVFLHEYQWRPSYFIIEKYYQYIYHWDYLTAFKKKKDVPFIPIEVQKKYWDKSL